MSDKTTPKDTQVAALDAALPLGLADTDGAGSDRAQTARMDGGARPLWVPIRRLGRQHHHLLKRHLLALDPVDRQRRFGHAVSDSMLLRYAQSLDYTADAIFGVFNRRLRLVAMAHLALPAALEPGQKVAGEFGVSVSHSARRRGLGTHLFEHCIVHARNCGVRQLVIHVAADNLPMLQIVRKAGAELQHKGNEVEAHLDLSQASWGSHLEALVDEEAAKADFGLKLQLRRLDELWQCSWAAVKTRLSADTQTGDAHPGSQL